MTMTDVCGTGFLGLYLSGCQVHHTVASESGWVNGFSHKRLMSVNTSWSASR